MKPHFAKLSLVVPLFLAGSSLAQPFNLVPSWNLIPGSRPYLTTDSTQRGLAYNPTTGHLLLVNRAGGLSVNILDAGSGGNLGTLNLGSIITGGTFPLSMIGVGSDGAIYAGNLTVGSGADPFKLYRWANETAAPTLAFSGNPSPGNNQRYGDTMDVRGAGLGTQILLGSRNGTNAALFSSADGSTYSSTVVVTPGISGGDLGLGITYGAGNTYWGKGSSGTTLRLIDLTSGTLLQSYAPSVFTNTFSPIGVDPGNNLLAGISIATPDRVVLYDISNSLNSSNPPVFLDSEIFATDNANGFSVGSVEFGAGKLFILDNNHGIAAYSVVPEPAPFLLCFLAGLIALIAGPRLRSIGRP